MFLLFTQLQLVRVRNQSLRRQLALLSTISMVRTRCPAPGRPHSVGRTRTEPFSSDYLICSPGAVFLSIVTIMPAIAVQFGVNDQFAVFYGGTSLLIMVGVVLDTLQQIESHLLMRHYDGLMKTGKIKGRSSVPTPSI